MQVKRISQLDGIRGLAVGIVLVDHLGALLDIGMHKNFAVTALNHFMECGWLGVDIFFVLSGFLITGILLKDRARPRFWSNFYARRAFRIAPAFLVVFATTLVLAHFFAPQYHASTAYVLMATFFMANWTILADNQMPLLFHIWSLAVEEQFYFLWPQAAKRLSNLSLFRLAMGLAVLSCSLRIVLNAAHISPYVLYEITPTRIDGISLGAALAVGMTLPRVHAFLIRWWRRIGLVAAIWLPVAFAIRGGSLAPFNGVSQILAIPATVVLTAMLIFGSVQAALPSLLARFFGTPVLTYLGRRSYGLYLIHDPIRVAVSRSRLHGYLSTLPGNAWVNLLLSLGVLAVALVLTELSWRLIESPAQNLRGRLMRMQEKSGETSLPSDASEEAAAGELAK